MATFPTTAWSLISRARRSDASQAALASLCEAYWYPLYSYARASGLRQDDARDVTQGYYIVHLLEKDSLQKVRSRERRFRCFLLASFRNFLSKERDHDRAIKRGGRLTFLSLDVDGAEARHARGRGCDGARRLPPDERAFFGLGRPATHMVRIPSVP